VAVNHSLQFFWQAEENNCAKILTLREDADEMLGNSN
jgi:hypothetical protein